MFFNSTQYHIGLSKVCLENMKQKDDIREESEIKEAHKFRLTLEALNIRLRNLTLIL